MPPISVYNSREADANHPKFREGALCWGVGPNHNNPLFGPLAALLSTIFSQGDGTRAKLAIMIGARN